MIKHTPIIDAKMLPKRAVMTRSFEVLDQGHVDGEPWYVVQVEPKVSRWIHEQDSKLWYDHRSGSYMVLNTFDVHEQLLTLITLRWS